MRLNNLQLYSPEDKPQGEDVQYYIDADGKDWFESLPLFTKPFAIGINPETSIIYCSCENVSTMYPLGLDVIDVDALPTGINEGWWMWDGAKIVPVPTDHKQAATARVNELMTAATSRINALVEAQDDDDITQEELAELAALRTYRSSLRRLDISTAPDITWPEMPVS
jgi:hypothetical protein